MSRRFTSPWSERRRAVQPNLRGGPMAGFQTKPIFFNRARRSADSLFLRRLRGSPPSKPVVSFDATVSGAPLELQKSYKALLPAIVFPIPDKCYRVQSAFALHRY